MSSVSKNLPFRVSRCVSSLGLLVACAGSAASDPTSSDLGSADAPAPGAGASTSPGAPEAPAAPGGDDPTAPSGTSTCTDPGTVPATGAAAPASDDPAPGGASGTSGAAPEQSESSAGDDVDAQLAALNQSFAASERASVGGTSYFRLRRDVRRCAAPLCGGFFVSRVNSSSTSCVDGARSAECYVTGLDLSALALGSAAEARVTGAPEELLLAGEIAPESTDFGELGRLRVTEAWQGHTGVRAEGAFLRVVNEGIVCITNPCPTFSAEILNARLPLVTIAEVDLEGIAGDASDGLSQLNEPEGLLVAALPEIVSGPGGRAIGLDASEYYLPISTAGACGSRGLPACPADRFCSFPSEANCGRADMPGVCAPKPEACTQQYDPVCGCDGQTYGNACAAASAGVSVETAGECNPSSD